MRGERLLPQNRPCLQIAFKSGTWLESGQLLLTDGVHFAGEHAADFSEEYVARLRGRGIRALGFAIGIVHDEVPNT